MTDRTTSENTLYLAVHEEKSLPQILKKVEHKPNHLFTIIAETAQIYHLKAQQDIGAYVHATMGLDEDATNAVVLALSEALNNAIEHGNLAIGDLKNRMATMPDLAGEYFDTIEKRLKDPKYGKKLIFIRCWRKGKHLVFEVEDQGKGFTKKTSVEQSDNMTPSGRGLSFLEMIADCTQHTKGGRCVQFSFLLPSTVENYDATSLSTIRENSSIVLADDQQIDLQLASHVLRQSGFKNVFQAHNGEEALHMTREIKPDLVLLDVVMSDMDGFEVCRRLKSHPKTSHIPVMFISSLTDVESRVRGYEVGGVDYINKPVEHHEMTSRVEVHIRNGLMMGRLRNYSARIQKDMELAQMFQKSLLPKSKDLQEISKQYGITLKSTFMPCDELAGDYWAALPLSDHQLALALVDFSGHGMLSALNTVKLHGLMRECEDLMISPNRALAAINETLHTFLDTGTFATAIFGVYDQLDHSFIWAGAGAPPFAILKANGTLEWGDCQGTPLGIIPTPERNFSLQKITLEPHDTLFFYSDALTEGLHENETRWEEKGLEEALKKALKTGNNHNTLNYVEEQFFNTAQKPLKDDLTLITLTRTD